MAIIVGHGPKRNDSAHMPNVATADTTSAKGNRASKCLSREEACAGSQT